MKSARLTYRPLDYTDAARITHLAGDWDVARMTARIPHPYTLTQAHKWIGSLEEGEVVRVVELDGQLIGAVGYIPDAGGSAEIGYWIGRPWWGNGYATEAAGALVHHCFTEAGYARLTCCHFFDNPASARIIRKLGFRVTGPCKAWCEARGAEVATVRYQKKRPMLMRVGWVDFARHRRAKRPNDTVARFSPLVLGLLRSASASLRSTQPTDRT